MERDCHVLFHDITQLKATPVIFLSVLKKVKWLNKTTNYVGHVNVTEVLLYLTQSFQLSNKELEHTDK